MYNTSLVLDTVLFDLDGTLVDTAPALAATLNSLRRRQGRPPLEYDQIRPVVSQGGAALITLAFADVSDTEVRETLRQEFLELYARRLGERPQESPLFPGMAALLDDIQQRGWRWGIVTNKPLWLTEPLLKALELNGLYGCLVCGDQISRSKPDPEGLLLACRQIGCQPDRTLYIGDAQRDIEAGRAAGLYTMVAGYGYLASAEDPTDWGADAVVTTVAGIGDWLQTHAAGE